MALETLRDVKEIDGFEIEHVERMEEALAPGELPYITICHDDNEILFRIQDGPIKENGVNGCQVDTLIETCIRIIQGLNEKNPCVQNMACLSALYTALTNLKARKQNREERGVEGTNQL